MLARALADDRLPPKLFLIHGGPGAQGSLYGLGQLLPIELRPREILQRYAGDVRLSVAQHVADMAQIICSPANILGHSWGAMLSLSFACQFPSRCEQLILVGCGTYSSRSRAEYERRIGLRTDPTLKSTLKAAIAAARDEVEHEQAFREFAKYATLLQAFDPIPDPSPDPETKFDPNGHPETWLDAMRLQSEGIEPARFSSITCPVTLIQGREDPHPGQLIYQDLLPHIPQLKLIEIPNCGHEPWLEKHGQAPFLKIVEQLCHG